MDKKDNTKINEQKNEQQKTYSPFRRYASEEIVCECEQSVEN